ncbi:hypothetical protein ACPB67_02565 [Micromonospora taraxaci]|uniref:hypothetical protein n=1 Tax=Micromonospora taraxaci TaxID=1316803 RepID=UPI003C2D9179
MKPYTDADVKLLAAELRDTGMKDAFFDDSSGSWEVEQKPHQYEAAAAAMLDALAAAGRLLPADATTEWTWQHNAYVSIRSATTDRAEAEQKVQRCRAVNPGDPVTLMRRTVTDWTSAEARP